MSFPAALDTAEDLLIAANNFATKCLSFVEAGATEIVVESVFGLPPSGVVSIDSEVLRYAYIDDTGLNPILKGCTRGPSVDGTQAAQHADGSKVELRWVALHHNTLSAAIRAIEAALGVNPQGSAADVATFLSTVAPVIVPKSSGTVWTFTHNKRRIVSVQLWRKVATNQYELFNAAVNQEINLSGTSTVTIDLAEAEEGYVVFN